MDKQTFQREVIPKLHELEARADGVLDFREQQRIRAISTEIRAIVCEISEDLGQGRNVKARIRYVREMIRRVL